MEPCQLLLITYHLILLYLCLPPYGHSPCPFYMPSPKCLTFFINILNLYTHYLIYLTYPVPLTTWVTLIKLLIISVKLSFLMHKKINCINCIHLKESWVSNEIVHIKHRALSLRFYTVIITTILLFYRCIYLNIL